jgi:hypothetical protein
LTFCKAKKIQNPHLQNGLQLLGRNSSSGDGALSEEMQLHQTVDVREDEVT